LHWLPPHVTTRCVFIESIFAHILLSHVLGSSAEFIKGISLFSVQGDREKKLECKSASFGLGVELKDDRAAVFAVSPPAPPLTLLAFTVAVAFKIYDVDKDGYISNGELFYVLKLMVGNNLKDTQLQQVCGKGERGASHDFLFAEYISQISFRPLFFHS
jgi:hypothetical protein